MLTDRIMRWPFLMPEDSGSGGGSGASDRNDGDQDGDGAGEGGDELTTLRTTLQKVRDEKKAADKNAADLAKRLKTIEDADKTELQKAIDERDALNERLTKAELKARDASSRTAVYDAAKASGAEKPKVIHALIKDSIEYDDDHEPTNIDALIKALKTSDPDLFREAEGGADGGAATTKDRRGARTPNDVLRAQLRGR